MSYDLFLLTCMLNNVMVNKLGVITNLIKTDFNKVIWVDDLFIHNKYHSIRSPSNHDFSRFSKLKVVNLFLLESIVQNLFSHRLWF